MAFMAAWGGYGRESVTVAGWPWPARLSYTSGWRCPTVTVDAEAYKRFMNGVVRIGGAMLFHPGRAPWGAQRPASRSHANAAWLIFLSDHV